MNYAAALEFLDSHINMETGVVHDATEKSSEIIPGRSFDPPSLQRMRRLCAFLGDPQLDLELIHVTGTNGKGSTARMAASLLKATGLSTGLYTSPHLHKPNERIVIDLADVSNPEFADIANVLRIAESGAGQRNSWFELITAGAFRHFSDIAVEACVVEVGAGGRWDATNVADGKVCVVTNIDLDHQQWFGETKREIAEEKSGIFKPGCSAVIGDDDPEIISFLESAARRAGAGPLLVKGVDFACDSNRLAIGGRLCTLRTPTSSYPDIYLPLHGAHQGENAACALTAVEEFLGNQLTPDEVARGFATVKNPGRMEVVSRDPLVVLDGAHNYAGARVAATTLSEEFASNKQRTLIVGFLNGKDPGEMLDSLQASQAVSVIAVAPPSPRAMDPGLIAQAAARRSMQCRVADSVESALDSAISEIGENGLIFVCGSLYLVGAARTYMLS